MTLSLVHLVRAANGRAPFDSFLRSYEEHEAGVEHDLVLLFKGFPGEADADEYREQLGGRAHTALFVSDDGYDIGNYFVAAQSVRTTHVCFLNSFSRILAKEWLAHLDRHVRQPGVGLVGASGSCESAFSGFRESLRESGDDRRRSVVTTLREIVYGSRLLLSYPRFPNAHVRSNAFLIERDLFLSLSRGPLASKSDVLAFESGRKSMTRQVLARGLRALVVGRDGRGYEIEEWPSSNTFRTDEQANLLVEDNRTRQYRDADDGTRRRLTRYAWGPEAVGK